MTHYIFHCILLIQKEKNERVICLLLMIIPVTIGYDEQNSLFSEPGISQNRIDALNYCNNILFVNLLLELLLDFKLKCI